MTTKTVETFDVKSFLAGFDLSKLLGEEFALATGKKRTDEQPCPICGGVTRAWYWIGDDGIGRLSCSHCKPQGYDAIEYTIERQGLTNKTVYSKKKSENVTISAFWQAVCILRGDTSAAMLQPREYTPQQGDHAPAERWQSKARAFASACEKMLWSSDVGARALDYLHGRGLTDETIRRFHIGCNPMKRIARGADWGIERDIVTAVAGITIPREILGEMWAVNVRRMNDDGTPYSGKDKYITLTGSALGLFGADDLNRDAVAMAFGGEFDAILAAQHAPAGVACVTFGGEGRRIVDPWQAMLSNTRRVLVAYDNDKAGDHGATNWADLPRAKRVRVPTGKDLTEYAQSGGDAMTWIADKTGIYTPEAYDEALNAGILEYLDRMGYATKIGDQGQFIAERGGTE